ncbi:thioesterase II family protein [Verminephrobacter aporrectodeae]|uniref:thioesterase II family protein n=1 Tax=Verminephrobacter aporrectodeae TaxID=1110389 RepID=UPI0034DB4009
MPTLKADFDLVASYSYGGRAALPLLVLHGADDPHADAARVAGWADEAQGGCTLKRLPGDHFFFEWQEARIIRLLADQLLTANCDERAAP